MTFVERAFERQGLMPLWQMAHAEADGSNLVAALGGPEAFVELIARAQLPLLMKLVEKLRRDVSTVQCRGVLLVELAAALNARRSLLEFIDDVQKRFPDDGRHVTFVLDRWTGDFPYTRFLDSLIEVRQAFPNSDWLGPSASEIRLMLKARENRGELSAVLESLERVGLCSIEGGDDREILLAGLQRGFRMAIGQAVNVELDDAAAHAADVRRLLELRPQTLGDVIDVWFPWNNRPLGIQLPTRGSHAQREVFAERLLRLVATARLVLHHETTVRAPLTLFGPKAAHVAIDCGATDIGFVALEKHTAEVLNLALWSEIEKVWTRHGTKLCSKPFGKK